MSSITPPMAPHRPLTVGLLVDALGDSYQWAIFKGALEAARDRGANLLCFEHGALRADASTGLLSLIGRESVDGLIVLAGALGNTVGPDALRAMCERLAPLPMCFVALDVPGYSSVLVDNDAGAREVLGHLVVHHGMRRVAFVRGPEANVEAERRFQAYCDALAGASIPFDPALVAVGDFTPEAGRRAVSILLDERRARTGDLEAIACANDAMALGVLEALERRGIRVPEQVAVVGFDDVEEARFTTPPLTTVRQPLSRQGREAVRMVLARDADRPERLVLGTQLCVRRSCGCFSQRGAVVPTQPSPLGMEAALMARRDVILADLARSARGQFAAAGMGWEARLISAFTTELTAGSRAGVMVAALPAGVPSGPVRAASPNLGFVETYDDLLRRLVAGGVDPVICYDVVATLRRHLLRCVGADRRERALTEALLEQIAELTGTVMERVQAWQRIDTQRRARLLGRASSAISAALQGADVASALAEHLPGLGVESCYLSVLDPAEPGELGLQGSTAHVVVAYDAHARLARMPQRHAYRAEEILPRALITLGRTIAYAVALLPSRAGDPRLLVMEVGSPVSMGSPLGVPPSAPAEGHVYEALRHLFSAAFEGSRLVASLTADERALEATHARLSIADDAVTAGLDRVRAIAAHGDVGAALAEAEATLSRLAVTLREPLAATQSEMTQHSAAPPSLSASERLTLPGAPPPSRRFSR